jgi:L-amino acid N-acyltransferase YncA
MLIRKATPDDAEAIVRIFNPIIQSGLYTVIDGPFTVADERSYIQNFPERGVFHVAVCPETKDIVGFQSVEPIGNFKAFSHVANIGTFVDSAQRRRGVGTRLSEVTFEAARQKEFEKIFTCVRADNPDSLRFHLKLGFTIVGVSHKHAKVGGEYVDEIFIQKFL